ncbi:hypothetical protein [Protofrankia symbiont of Coriaria ruscifolia]|uniref:Putative membrane protein n=1 Tax=Candidatus Protofrankia californiensis TaxID=1839754 RepID=A0A1C3PBY6_9ACTN|nr:hypothetical protein [Protofrankia symbiont of Coriaria ruscifolia]SBW27321.1 putative membrane protein [Candidatus Protofrankia californiensis]
MSPQPQRRNAELVRAATITATADRNRRRNRRSPLTALPFAVAATAVAAGTALHTTPTAVAVAGVAIAAVCGDVAVTRRPLTPQDRGSARLAVLTTAGIVLAAATAPLSLRFGLVVTAVAVAASWRIGRHPTTRRRKRTGELAEAWPQAAATVGHPELTLNGPVIDRGVEGYTYRVMVPAGKTIEFLDRLAGPLASALGLRADQVQTELDPDWNRLGAVHIREADPRDSTGELVDVTVDTVADPIPVGPYADGKPFNLHMFIDEFGAISGMAAGDMGSGKSSLVVRILKVWRRTPDVVVLFADGANGRDFGIWKNSFFRYTTEPREFLAWVKILGQFADNREREMARQGWRVWKPSATHPVVVLKVEEMSKFGNSPYGSEIAQGLGRLASRSRAIGLIIFGLTQYPVGLNALGPDVRRGMANRVQFRDGENGSMILSALPPRQIRAAENGTFYAETRDENRRMTAQVFWTPDDERPAIITDWESRDYTAFAVEWAAAERRTPPAAAAGNTRRPQPDPDSGDEQLFAGGPAAATNTVEGQVLAVVPTEFPPIRPLPARGPELTYDEADREFRVLLREHGQVTSRHVEQAVGWRRGRVRRELIAPAIDAGWLTPTTDTHGDRIYTPVPEWLRAERAAR